MTTILDINKPNSPKNYYAQKSFMQLLFTFACFCIFVATVILQSYLTYARYNAFIFDAVIALALVFLAIFSSIGLYNIAKSIRNREPNCFKKYVALLGNSFFVVFILLLLLLVTMEIFN